ncbi:hypothetical protein [Actinomarinicola tropica]|uniref:Uncharacterized protein n=1 Tax=Actinomarinicola tropica TaxID=2789776 RepID=A0A5Q2RMN6_9ACTN|nr:hypothetical protein [Actinomarinicola tropica]QGG96734.1 hypothetical protein GH723_17425 [Actinomarinicola tropica]
MIDEGELGAISLYLMLAARIDPVAALHATDAWAGDAFVTSRDLEGDLCTRIVAATRDATSADVLDAALSDWVAAAPERSLAEAVRRGERFDVTSCDPGPGSDMGIVVDPMEALALPATRSFVIYGVVDQGFEPEVGVCVWDELLVAVPVKALVAPAPPPRVVGQVQDTLMDALLSCRRDVG